MQVTRGFAARLIAAALTLIAPSGLASARQQQTASPATAVKPDVLFIAVDDLNTWIGALKGHPDVQTPHIDRLARRGMLFTRAYCSAPSCNPSRASLLTGVRPSTSGVYENDNPWRPVLPNVVTLPQHFKANGYDVVGAGKIFHNSYNDPASWDRHLPPQRGKNPPQKSINGLASGHFDWGPIPGARDADMGDYKVVSWAVERLNERGNKPLFLAVGMTRPHLPWYVPPAYFDQYPLEKITLPPVNNDDLGDIPAEGKRLATRSGDHAKVVKAGAWKKAVQAYLASISFMDAQIGRLLEGLDKSGRAKNTIVMFWGDHGWSLGEKEHWRKFALWEEPTRVPLIIAAPGVTQAGATCARTVSLMDLYPTLIELCGLPNKAGIEALSIAPLLKNPTLAWEHPAVTTYLKGNHAVRSERWRYIRYHDGGEELYDHNADPRESKNLAGEGQFASVKKELARFLPKTDAPTAPRVKGGGGE